MKAVALGAAVQSGIIQGDMGEIVLLLDVTSMALGIETEGDGFEKLIDKNTTIPTKKTKAFTTVDNNQRQVRIHVLQGDEKRASLNTSLAFFDLIGIPASPAGHPSDRRHVRNRLRRTGQGPGPGRQVRPRAGDRDPSHVRPHDPGGRSTRQKQKAAGKA